MKVFSVARTVGGSRSRGQGTFVQVSPREHPRVAEQNCGGWRAAADGAREDDHSWTTVADSRPVQELTLAVSGALIARRTCSAAFLFPSLYPSPPPSPLVPSSTRSTTLAPGYPPHYSSHHSICLFSVGSLHWRPERHGWSGGRHPTSAWHPSYLRYGCNMRLQGTPLVRAAS